MRISVLLDIFLTKLHQKTSMATAIMCESPKYHPGMKVSYDFVWLWISAVCYHDTQYNYRKTDTENQCAKHSLKNQVQ
jgi:hypothetical protein